MPAKTNLFPVMDDDKPNMRYRIEVNLLGEGYGGEPTTLFADDKLHAEMTFRHFLNGGFRPVRLIDTENDRESMSAENGLRTRC